MHEKQKIALRPDTAFRGYQRLGDNVTRYDGGFQRDHHEAIDLYKEEPNQVRLMVIQIRTLACNVKPSGPEIPEGLRISSFK